MIGIRELQVFGADLPFKKPFRHAAAVRETSSSIFLKCVTDDGSVGYGETLPRAYVTGETREGALALLEGEILPRLVRSKFSSLEEVVAFLESCDGKAPAAWIDPATPQTAAWCAVDLALLDAFSKAFRTELRFGDAADFPPSFRYSTVISGEGGRAFVWSLLKARLFGFERVKLKLGEPGTDDDVACRVARAVLGRRCDIRVDVNMGWSAAEATLNIPMLRRHGVRLFESPIDPVDRDGLTRLARETGGVMIDEGFHDRDSLADLVARKACNAVNVRIAKCGGLIAALARCKEAMAAGLTVQIGCQTGESSLLSAAHLRLLKACGTIAYGESCFGRYLLREDPASPVLQFGFGGRPPPIPSGFGLGVTMDEETLARWTTGRAGATFSRSES